MTRKRNPQAEQMADESMIRNLAAQASAIWPQEQALFERYGLAGRVHIADIGCGSGEITARLAQRYPDAQLVGIDILESSVAHARRKYQSLAPRVRFEQGDAFDLQLRDGEFDLAVCRHMTQAIPEPEKVLAELNRILKPCGWMHVLSEDYGMLHMPAGAVDPDRLWHEGAIAYARNTGTDARVGRRTWALMHKQALGDLRVDYVIVDTTRVPRGVFASIIEAWRDGYTSHFDKESALRPGEARALFDQAIATILDPSQYAVWQVPVVSGRKPRPVPVDDSSV
jgi:ubiquinone/menaquinone biosynthesis C-methylase UbiE